MSRKCTENTLVIGNGFSRSVFDGIPSWGNLFEEEKVQSIIIQSCMKHI